MNDSNKGLKIAVAILVLAVVVLTGLLIKSREPQPVQVTDTSELTNQIQETTIELDDSKQTIKNLEADLASRQAEIITLSNTLAITLTNQDQAQVALHTAENVITKLEEHNHVLETRANDLSSVISDLTAKIENITQKLTSAEGDRAALSAELQRLTAEKLELERQFNDLDVLRAKVKKLKSEQAIERRLDWKRAGIQTTEPKAAEKMVGSSSPTPQSSRYDLNVEVNEDGTLKVIPALTQ